MIIRAIKSIRNFFSRNSHGASRDKQIWGKVFGFKVGDYVRVKKGRPFGGKTGEILEIKSIGPHLTFYTLKIRFGPRSTHAQLEKGELEL